MLLVLHYTAITSISIRNPSAKLKCVLPDVVTLSWTLVVQTQQIAGHVAGDHCHCQEDAGTRVPAVVALQR